MPIFLLLGIGLILYGVQEDKKGKSRCCIECIATVVSIKRNKHACPDAHARLRRPVYEYFYKDNLYEVSGCGRNYNLPKVNEKVKIFINPNNPQDIYEKGNSTAFYVSGISFIALVVIYYVCILFA